MFPMNCFWIKQYRTGTLKELFLKEYFTPIKRGTGVNACHLRILSIFDQLWKPNIVAAARYYEYGARAGVAAAQYELARIYIDKEMGDACFIGGANPYIGCERWLKKAAEQNYIYAEELLADKYYEGVYIVKDVKAAIYWYEKAANQGSVYAMYRAGYIYYSEPIDYNKAGQWFSLAAEKGDKDAEEVLRNNLRYNRFTKKWDAVR